MADTLLEDPHTTSARGRNGDLRNRALHDQGQKQSRTRIYGHRPPFLFVPLERMWHIRDAAKVCREREGKVAIAGIARALGEPVHNIEATIAHWRELYGDKEWFDPWLLDNKQAPDDVCVATLSMIRRCRAAWDHMVHCRKAGIRETSYYRWFKNGLIPDQRFVWWLYGATKPLNCFVVYPELQRLRKEKTRDRILRHARVGKTTLARWEDKPRFREALSEAIEIAAKGGTVTELANKYPPWTGLKPRMQKCMWRYAQAASLTACCRRAGIAKKHYWNLMSEAKRKGVSHDLERYLNGEEGQSEGRGFGRGRLVAGLIAKNLYVPTGVLERDLDRDKPKGMFAFQEVAAAEMAKQNISALKDLPHFVDWFLDWVIPWGRQGQRVTLPNAAAETGSSDLSQGRQVPAKPPPGGPPDTPPRHRKRRGRKKGWRDPDVTGRQTKMLEAWDRGEFGKNKAAAARAYGFNRPDASKIIREHEAARAKAAKAKA
jgi:hypothetical protein